MSENNVVVSKVKRIRGTANPYVGLEQAIGFVDMLRNAVGRGPFSREVAAQGLKHQTVSGPASGKIAALVHFGLLSRQGNAYSVAHLADRILLPTSDEDRINAIAEAARKPKLYKQLIDKYQNQSLPSLLDNILAREFGINEKTAKVVSKHFRKTLEYAGLLKNGVVTENIVADLSQEQPAAGTTPVQALLEERGIGMASPDSYLAVLPSGIKIQFPETLKFNLSLGDFSEGIKKLSDLADQILEGNKGKGAKS